MSIITTEKNILKKAAQMLRQQTGLSIEKTEPLSSKDFGLDYKISLTEPSNDTGKTRVYWAEIKKNVGSATLGEAALLARRTPERFVLVADYVSAAQADKLRELNVPFFDAAGNAYFNEPGLYVFVSGRKAAVKPEKPIDLFSPNGIKLLLALLTEPKLVNHDYRTIADTTDVPRTTIGRTLANLERAGYLIRRDSRTRRLVNIPELIKRWVNNYSERFRPKLKPVRFRSKKYEGRWWEEVDLANYNAVWGGETGGALLTRHLKPERATIFSDSLLPRLQLQYGLIRDPRGNVEILKKFWTIGEVDNVAPPLVVYADLVASANERNLETAQMIYDRYLAELAETAS